jgi:basic amino acid/polyamine antiporter, APA family
MNGTPDDPSAATPAALTSDLAPGPTLQRTMGGWQVLFYGLGSMLGAGIYALVGKAAGIMGNAVWAGFLAAMVGALLTGLSYASAGSRYPRAGGAAFITGRAFRAPALSTAVGIAVMMSGLTSMATGLQAIAGKLLDLNEPTIASKLLAIGTGALLGLVIYRGIRESIWLNTLCTAIEAGGLLFIIAVGCRYWGGVDYFETPPVKAGGGAATALTAALIMQGAVLTFYSFIGFEDILNVSEEVKNPRRNVPFGLVGAMIAATLIYVAVAITAVSVLGWEALSKSAHPLDDVAAKAAPWFKGIGTVYFCVTIFAIGNTALLNYLMGSRLLYGMGTQGLLPATLSRVHPRRHTPHIAVFFLFGIVSVLIMAGGIAAMAEATVLLLLAVFTAMNAALVLVKLRGSEPRGGFEIPFVVPILGALACAALFGTRLYRAIESDDSAVRTAPLVAVIILVIGGAIGFLRGNRGAAGQELPP